MAISREEQLKILGQMKDSDIDYSDAAPTDEEFWKDAVLHIPSEKVQVSVRRNQNAIAYRKKRPPLRKAGLYQKRKSRRQNRKTVYHLRLRLV